MEWLRKRRTRRSRGRFWFQSILITFFAKFFNSLAFPKLWKKLQQDQWGTSAIVCAVVYFFHAIYLSYADRVQDYSWLGFSYLVAALVCLLTIGFSLRESLQRRKHAEEQSQKAKSMLSESHYAKLMASKKLRRAGDFIIQKDRPPENKNSEPN